MNSQSLNPIQVIAVTGGKGGVGKTNVSVNLGVSLCRLGRRVTLLDADFGLANADVLLGLKPNKNLHDVLQGDADLNDIVIGGPQGLRIVPAASGVQEMATLGVEHHAGLISAFSKIAHQMDTLLIDTAAGISAEVMSFLAASQEVVLVVCNEPTSITDAYALIKVLSKDYGVNSVRIVANMVRSERDGAEVFAKLLKVSERFLDVALDKATALPFDDHLRRAVKRQRAVVELYPNSQISGAFRELAQEVDSWPIPITPSGHLEFFVERLVGA